MASRKGFEPLTYGLGNRCSILLSYRDPRAPGMRAHARHLWTGSDLAFFSSSANGPGRLATRRLLHFLDVPARFAT